MQIFILTALAVIIGTAIFIAFTLRWLSNQWKDSFFSMDVGPLIIEKAYKAVDLRAQFQYMTVDDFQRGFMNYPMNRPEHLVHNEDHKQRILHDYTHQLAKKMLDGGLIEINERDIFDRPNMRQIDLRCKVYKPDPATSLSPG